MTIDVSAVISFLAAVFGGIIAFLLKKWLNSELHKIEELQKNAMAFQEKINKKVEYHAQDDSEKHDLLKDLIVGLKLDVKELQTIIANEKRKLP
jgi:HAMP domain-containing protein